MAEPAPLQRKRCCMCRRWKALQLFNADKNRADGLSSRCRACNKRHCRAQYTKHTERYKDRRRRNRYGISAAEYQSRLATQGGVCAICREPPKRQSLYVDHDHQTGETRGLLCAHCNTGLGGFRDDPRRLLAAAQYLERWRAGCNTPLQQPVTPVTDCPKSE